MYHMKYYNKMVRGLGLDFERFEFTECTITLKKRWEEFCFLLFFLELRRLYDFCYSIGDLAPQQLFLKLSQNEFSHCSAEKYKSLSNGTSLHL